MDPVDLEEQTVPLGQDAIGSGVLEDHPSARIDDEDPDGEPIDRLLEQKPSALLSVHLPKHPTRAPHVRHQLPPSSRT